VGVRATLHGAWLSALYRRRGIAAINRRLLLAGRCEELLVRFGASVGQGCVLHGPLVVHNANPDYRNLSIGDNVHVGPLVLLDLAERLVLEDDATVSMGTTILTHADVGDRPLADIYPRTVEPGSARTRPCWSAATSGSAQSSPQARLSGSRCRTERPWEACRPNR